MLDTSFKVRYVGSFLMLVLSSNTGADHHCPVHCVCFSTITDCSDIGFTKVPTDDINPKTTVWFLSNNLIRYLSADSFQLGTLLEKKFLIDLRSNMISEIENNTFSSLDNLEVLNLADNYISNISHLALKAENLRVLDLSKNEHLELPEQGFETPRLQVLSLEKCLLSSIPQQFFKHMKKIETINLSHNLLTTIDPYVFHTSKQLQNLHLSFNLLTDLLWLPMHHLPKNLNLLLNGNHIRCACVYGHTVEILTRSYVKCYYNNTEVDLSIFLTRNCSSPLNSTMTSPTTTVNPSSRGTEDGTTPTVAGSVTLLASSTAVTSSSTNTTLHNVNGTEADDVKTPVAQDHRNTMGYYGLDWMIGVISALGLVAVAVLVAISVSRRRKVRNSDSQRFSILKSDEQVQ